MQADSPIVFCGIEDLIISGSIDFDRAAILGQRSLIGEILEPVIEDFAAGDRFFVPSGGGQRNLPGNKDIFLLEHEVPMTRVFLNMFLNYKFLHVFYLLL